jgi:hypothetical protein
MMVTRAQHVDCYEARVLAREMHRGEHHSEQPIGVLAIVCQVAPTLSVSLVRSRRRQLLKTTKPPPDAKGRAQPLLFILR